MTVKPFEFELISPQTHCEAGCGCRLEARSGHRIVIDEANLYSVGGYNPKFWDLESENNEDTAYPLFKELWKYNLCTHRWERLKTTDMPSGLASHTIVRIGNHILHFGGTGVPFGSASINSLSRLDLNTLNWTECQCTGDAPDAKYGHTMTHIDQYIYVVGGTTGYIYNMDVHRLDLRSYTWEKLKNESEKCIPEPRYRHEVIHFNNKLYMFGGGLGWTGFDLDKISVFDLKERQWETVETEADEKAGYPGARKCHSCVLHGSAMYLCGGFDNNQIRDDVWKLCLVNLQWKKLPVTLPLPVYFHSAAVTPAGCMYVFGGVTRVDDKRTNVIQRIWLQIPPLKELCWEKLTYFIDTDFLKTHTRKDLLEIGIPNHFVDRIPF